jgi:circadian clock protein KaiB
LTPSRHKTEGSLTLFVSGASDLSARAITHARTLCDVHLDGTYQLSIVDVHEDPAAVLSFGVMAAPTLVRTRPLPARRFIGDLSRAADVLSKLELPLPEPAAPRATDTPR